jgi:hypothetical protein
MLQSLMRNYAGRGMWFAAPVFAGLLFQVALSFGVWLDHRPIVFSINSEVMAGLGFAAFGPSMLAWITGTLTMGVSGARIVILLLVFGAMAHMLRGRKLKASWSVIRFTAIIEWGRGFPILIAAAIVGLMFVWQALAISPQRLTLRQLSSDASDRGSLVSLSDPVISKASIDIHRPDLSARPAERVWSWYGYGYRAYVERTAASTPHNIYVLAWYELGLLAIPFVIAALLLLFRLPLWLALTMMLYAGAVDMWYWMPSGVYALAFLSYHYVKAKGVTVPSGATAPLS